MLLYQLLPARTTAYRRTSSNEQMAATQSVSCRTLSAASSTYHCLQEDFVQRTNGRNTDEALTTSLKLDCCWGRRHVAPEPRLRNGLVHGSERAMGTWTLWHLHEHEVVEEVPWAFSSIQGLLCASQMPSASCSWSGALWAPHAILYLSLPVRTTASVGRERHLPRVYTHL